MDKITNYYPSTKIDLAFNPPMEMHLVNSFNFKNEIESKFEERKILSYEDFVQGLEKQEEEIKLINKKDLFDSKIKSTDNQVRRIIVEENFSQNYLQIYSSLKLKPHITDVMKNINNICDLSK